MTTKKFRKSRLLVIVLIIVNLLFLQIVYGQSNTGLKSATTAFNLNNVPTYANALISDNAYASFTTNGDASAYGSFGFTTNDAGGVIPSGALILGIEVQLEGNRVAAGGQFTRDLNISLSWNNGATYTTAITMTRFNSGTDATVLVGGSNNTWGRTWAVSELTNPNFRIRCQVPAAAQGSINLDFVQVRVYYCVVPGAPSVTSPIDYCLNSTAVPLTAVGSNLLWYTVASGGTGLPGAPTPLTTATGTIPYYVSQTIGCEGPRAEIDVAVFSMPVSTVTSQSNITCFDAHDGSITVTASNGASPYTFSVDDGANYLPATGTDLRLFTGLQPNIAYRIKVKDNNGCISK